MNPEHIKIIHQNFMAWKLEMIREKGPDEYDKTIGPDMEVLFEERIHLLQLLHVALNALKEMECVNEKTKKALEKLETSFKSRI